MSYPIYNKLNEILNNNIYPFHMPGHKRNPKFFDDNLYKYDFTEVNETDNLHNPTSIIMQLQNDISKYFNSDKSFISINGSSAGIISAIMTVCNPNDKILVARNCHISVYKGLILSGASPIYLYPEKTSYNIYGGISPEKIKEALLSYKNIKAVIITSPTYEGFCSDIEKISKYCHELNKILIVDEAHGAQFRFCSYFPKTAIESGADIAIQSWHKTLPVLNQCSIIHIKSKIVDIDRFKQMLSMIQTTSPSYILMLSLEKCFYSLLENGNKLFKNYIELLDEIINRFLKLKNIEIINKNIINKYCINNIDIGKLVLYINSHISGKELENILLKKYKIQIEMSSLNYIIAMTSIADTKEGFELLKNAIIDIDKNLTYNNNLKNNSIYLDNITIPQMSPRESTYAKSKKIKLHESVGCISHEFIIPYPPGIPIITPGEIITSDIIDKVYEYHKSNIEINGINDKTLEYINIINFKE